jgi:hypothetical protein
MAAAAAGLLLVGAVGWWFWVHEPDPPRLAPQREQAALLIVDEFLHNTAFTGKLSVDRPDLNPQRFCSRQVIESRELGTDLVIGVFASCQELARWGNMLITSNDYHDESWFQGPMLLTITEDRVRDCLTAEPMVQACHLPDLAPEDDHGLGPAGYRSPLTGEFYQTAPRDDYTAAIRKVFSPAGFQFIRRNDELQWPDLPSPDTQAKQQFGLPADAPFINIGER